MNSQEHYDPSDLPEPGSPDDINEFIDELDIIAAHSSHAHAATPDQIHAAEAVGALIRADSLIAGYFPGVNILNGSDLYAKEGELVGIIGPNGAGKSTLLKALFGLVNVTSGSVTLRDEDITNLRADQLVKRGVGFVPQTNNVFPSLTIEENMQMGAYQAPKTLRRSGSTSVVDLFPTLGERRKQRAGSLSGRRATDGGDGPRADDGAERAAARRAERRPEPGAAGRGLREREGASTRPASP